jgi:hypothetical protein
MMVLVILVFVCWILAAICNAVMDILAFKYKYSIFSSWNPNYWNPSISWRNKYKNRKVSNGPAFFGSTTFLVFTTDAWHLFQFFSNSFIVVSIILTVHVYCTPTWWQNIVLFIVFKIAWGAPFELFYSKIFRNGK